MTNFYYLILILHINIFNYFYLFLLKPTLFFQTFSLFSFSFFFFFLWIYIFVSFYVIQSYRTTYFPYIPHTHAHTTFWHLKGTVSEWIQIVVMLQPHIYNWTHTPNYNNHTKNRVKRTHQLTSNWYCWCCYCYMIITTPCAAAHCTSLRESRKIQMQTKPSLTISHTTECSI